MAPYSSGRLWASSPMTAVRATDGVEWHLYHLDGDDFRCVSSFVLDSRSLDVEGLIVWMDGVLATTDQLTPTPREIVRRLGSGSPPHALDIADLTALYQRSREQPSVRLKRELWAKLLTTALGTAFADEDELFVEHSLSSARWPSTSTTWLRSILSAASRSGWSRPKQSASLADLGRRCSTPSYSPTPSPPASR